MEFFWYFFVKEISKLFPLRIKLFCCHGARGTPNKAGACRDCRTICDVQWTVVVVVVAAGCQYAIRTCLPTGWRLQNVPFHVHFRETVVYADSGVNIVCGGKKQPAPGAHSGNTWTTIIS